MTKTSPKGTKIPSKKPCKILKAIQKLLMKITISQGFQKTEKSKSPTGLNSDGRNLMDSVDNLVKNHPEISIDEALKIEKLRLESRRRREAEPEVDVTINMRIDADLKEYLGIQNIDDKNPKDFDTPDDLQDLDYAYKIPDDVEGSEDMEPKFADVAFGIYGLNIDDMY